MEQLPFDLLYSEQLYAIGQKTTIVLTQPWDSIPAEEKVQLSRISDALKQRIHPLLSLDAFQVVVTPALDLSTWHEKPARLIYFGEAIKGLNFYEMIEADGTRMVLSESLGELLGNEAARNKLWQALKQLFTA